MNFGLKKPELNSFGLNCITNSIYDLLVLEQDYLTLFFEIL